MPRDLGKTSVDAGGDSVAPQELPATRQVSVQGKKLGKDSLGTFNQYAHVSDQVNGKCPNKTCPLEAS